jgi:hypothetical protein
MNLTKCVTTVFEMLMVVGIAACATKAHESSQAQREDGLVVEVLSQPESWTEDLTDDVDVSDIVGVTTTDTDFSYTAAQIIGLQDFAWAGDPEHMPEGPQGTCGNSGAAGCELNINWWDNTFTWRCWLRTMFGSGYCEGGGNFDWDYAPAPSTGKIIHITRVNRSRCGTGQFRGC